MRQKNKLYAVNRFNRPMFMPKENLFPEGGVIVDQIKPLSFATPKIPNLGTQLGAKQNQALGAQLSGLASKSPITSGIGSALKGSALSMGAGIIGGLANSAISGGLSTKGGAAISGLGSTIGGAVGAVNPVVGAAITVGTQAIGGLVNRAFGSKLNEEKIAEIEAEQKKRLEENNTLYGAKDTSSLTELVGNLSTGTNFSAGDVGEDGWFSDDAAEKYRQLKAEEERVDKLQELALANATDNVNENNFLNSAKQFRYAYGGPLDFGGGALGLMQQNAYFNTIDRRTDAIAGKNTNTAFTGGAKTFADGGLKAAFLDEFGKDPIAAAVRYNQGLEALAAQEEARQIEAQKAAEYADMQNRLLSLETQNQGLQALMAAQSVPTTTETAEETTESLSTPSAAAYNSNWDYIEDQLKRSGKFNDVQIQGIKYNLQRESGIGKFDGGDNGTARGLAQWRGNRIPKDLSLEGQTKYLIDTLSNYDGKLHWIGEDNYRGFLNARTPEEAHYYIAKGYERPASDIIAKVKRDSDMSLRNLNAFGGELGTNGTDFTNGLLYIDEGGSHESNPLDGVPMGLDPQGIPNLVEEGETIYNDYVFSDRMKVPLFMYKELGLGGVMKKKGKEMSFADASKKLAQESEQRPNDPISQDGLEASLAKLAEVQEAERMRKQGKEYMGLEGYACGGKMKNKYSKGSKMDSSHPYGDNNTTNTSEQIALMDAARNGAMPELGPSLSLAEYADRVTPDGSMEGLPTSEDMALANQEYAQQMSNEKQHLYPTWMRYAPAVGSGIMALTDALGITNKPDYTYADKIAAYAEKAGVAPHIGYKPIGDYLTYRPMDIWYEQNRMDANARATDRAIMNNAAPIGTKMAGLLASGYNNQIADGELYRKALEYNDAKRKDVADFNRRTNMFNSQMGLEAAMANARYHQAAQQMGLSGLAQAAAMRDSIDARVGAAKSANLSNFLTSLGNIGRENFAMNQLNWDKSRHYTTDASGKSGYKRKCGGKMNRK